jgi:hypothetical protein
MIQDAGLRNSDEELQLEANPDSHHRQYEFPSFILARIGEFKAVQTVPDSSRTGIGKSSRNVTEESIIGQ